MDIMEIIQRVLGEAAGRARQSQEVNNRTVQTIKAMMVYSFASSPYISGIRPAHETIGQIYAAIHGNKEVERALTILAEAMISLFPNDQPKAAESFDTTSPREIQELN